MSNAPRQIRIEGDVAYVPLTNGYEAVIDAADVPLVAVGNWYANPSTRDDGSILTVYAKRDFGKVRSVRLHRYLLNAGEADLVDHIDGDGLNNRRTNLRLVTSAQNAWNTRLRVDNASGYKGVFWDADIMRYRARINARKQSHSLGTFRCITAAALAYAKASRGLHGDFGRLA